MKILDSANLAKPAKTPEWKSSFANQPRLAVMGFFVLFLILVAKIAFGQTNPSAQTLPFSQNFSSFAGATTTYPAGFQGWTVTGSLTATFPTTAPTANQALAGGTNASTTAGIYDMSTKAGIVSTGSNMRTLALAINTTAHTFIAVSYTAATQAQLNAGRINELGLQYRIGTSGTFTNVSGTAYQNNATSTINTGTAASNLVTISAYLPIACEGQAVVQLRWIMRDISGAGNRPTFSVDDISITADIPPIVVNLDAISPGSLIEGTGPWTIQATAAAAVPANSTINIGITGPVSGELTTGDYTLGSSALVISAGNTVSSSTTLSVTDDAFCEGNEAITVTITTSAFGVAIGTSTQTMTIADNASDLVFPLPILNSPAATITFNTLALSGLSPNLPVGLYIVEQGVNANKTYVADPGGTTTGNIYSYGAAASSERALGSLGTGSMGSPTGGDQTLGIFYGFRLSNSTGSAINGLSVDYFGELWTKQGSLVDEIKFQFSTDATSINTGTWTIVSALSFTPSVDLTGYAGIANGAVNGDLPANRVQKTGSFLFGSNLANGASVWIRWFDYNSVGNDDGYGIDDVILTPINVVSTNYYSKSVGALDDLTTWGSNTNGSGSQPSSFSFPGLVLNVRNQANATINVNWNVTGTSSKVVVNNGSNLTIPAGLTISATVDVSNGGTLTLNNPSGYPSFGSLASNSTVAFSAGSSQPIPGGTYGNLSVSGGGTKTFSGLPIIILRNLTMSNVVTDYGAGSFTIGGNVTYNGTVTHMVSTNTNSFILNGSGLQSVSTNGNILRCFNFSSTKTQGGITLAANTSIDARNSVFLNFSGTAQFTDGGSSITGRNNLEFDGNAANYNLTGTTTLNFDQTSGSGNVRNNSTNNFAPVAKFYNLVLLNNGTGTATDVIIRGQNSYGTTVKNNLTIGGSSTLGGVDEQTASKVYIGGAFINNRIEATLQSDWNGKTIFYGSGTVNITAGTLAGVKSQRFDTILVTRVNAAIVIDGGLVLDGGLVGSGNHLVTLPATNLVNFIGSSSANILQGIFTIDRVLTSNTSANGLKLEPGATLNIADALSFATNAKVTTTSAVLRLLSTATKTARIDIVPSGASIIGNVTAERYIPAMGWHFLGTPLSGQTVADWNDDIPTQGPMPGVSTPNPGSNTSSIFLYNQAGTINDNLGQYNGWEVPTSSAIEPFKGYRVFTSSSKTLDNTGPVALGTQTCNLDWSGATPYKGYNLVVNPHLSAIDWTHAGIIKNNVANTVMMYNPTAGSYQYFGSPIGSVPLNAALNPMASGQGFMVKATASPASIIIPETAKVQISGTFLRTAEDASNRIHIRLTNTSQESDETLFKFVEGTSPEFDSETDATKLENTGLNLYTLTPEGNRMAISALPFESDQMIIPLGLKGSAGGNQLRFTGLEQLTFSANAFLRDNETGIVQDLMLNPDYPFQLSGSENNDHRFELIFTNGTVASIRANEIFSLSLFPNPNSNGCFHLKFGESQRNVQVEVLSMIGKSVFSENFSDAPNFLSVILPRSCKSGHYLVKVTSPKGAVTKQLTIR